MRTRFLRPLNALHASAVIACPTEAVWGFSCDPLSGQAVDRLLQIKQRSVKKGLILIAADPCQLQNYLADEISANVLASWPGPNTWLLPAAPWVPTWLTGGRDTLAVRVTGHGPAAELCQAWGGALVSTSANRAGRPAIRSLNRLRYQFGQEVDSILVAPLGGAEQPSFIRDGRTGAVIR